MAAAPSKGPINVTVIRPERSWRIALCADAQMVSTQAWRFHWWTRHRSTNYEVEYRSGLASTNAWMPGDQCHRSGWRTFEVAVGPPQPRLGFYRAKGFRLMMAALLLTLSPVAEGGGSASPVLVFNGTTPAGSPTPGRRARHKLE